MASQMFVYILAVVIIGLIAMIGFKGISSFIGNARLLELADFRDDFASLVYETRDIGEQSLFEEKLPSGFTGICFYDRESSPAAQPFQAPILEGFSKTNNLFLIRYQKPITSKAVEPFNITKLKLASRYLCVPTRDGYVRLKLTGAGKQGTRIENYVP